MAERYSPVVQASGDDAPALVIMGGKDEMVPPRHGTWMAEAQERASVEHKLVILPDANHSLNGNANRERWCGRLSPVRQAPIAARRIGACPAPQLRQLSSRETMASLARSISPCEPSDAAASLVLPPADDLLYVRAAGRGDGDVRARWRYPCHSARSLVLVHCGSTIRLCRRRFVEMPFGHLPGSFPLCAGVCSR
jgi:hypothetical protein